MTTKVKKPVVASDFRFAGSSERAIGANGEVNASDKKDALRNAHRLMEANAGGMVITAQAQLEKETAAREHAEYIKAARNDPAVHRVLGEKMADEIYMTANRKGFMRRFLARQELKQGQLPRFKVAQKNVTAFVYTGPTVVESQLVVDNYLMPPEVQIATRPFIPQNEINQSPNDVLEEKYVEALEGVMVAEDRMWYNLAAATIGVDNVRTTIAGTLSPLSLMNVRQNVARWGLKASYMLMASDLFNDIVGDASFIQAIEPVARHELVMTGEMAVLYGMTLISEGYRHPEHKVLSAGEFVIVSDQQFHGAYSDRGGVDSQPVNSVNEKTIGMGWLLSESIAMAIANNRSVAFGLRT